MTWSLHAEQLNDTPTPKWDERPWNRPTVHAAKSPTNARMIAAVEFRYHGMRIRGVRLFRNDDGTISVGMPQKQFGDALESVCYFHDKDERALFTHDVIWLYWHIFGKRMQERGA